MAPQSPSAPQRWFSTGKPPQGDILTPPFPEDAKEQEAQARSSKLFQKAVWERPADPYKILYADQLVHGLLMTNLDSDIPGTVRIKTTEPVEDRWGHGHTIIPVDTTFLGRQEGATTYGQQRLPAQIVMAIFPDGSAVNWNKGQAGDALGASGIPARVDNHYAKALLGVGLAAVLHIGVRAPFGSTSGFQPNLPQEFAQEATQGVSQQAQEVLRQQFAVRPTLTQEQGYPVSISFSENVSFMTQPTLIRQ
jgi:type IV secretion system protein VirB10